MKPLSGLFGSDADSDRNPEEGTSSRGGGEGGSVPCAVKQNRFRQHHSDGPGKSSLRSSSHGDDGRGGRNAPKLGWTAPWLTPDLNFRRRDRQKEKGRKGGEAQPPQRRSSLSSASFGTSFGSSGGRVHHASSSSDVGGGGGQLRRRNPPILTVILIKLDGCLPGYCSELSRPTASNAAKAARLLDESIASPPPRPAVDVQPPQQQQETSAGRMRQPLSSSPSSAPDSASNSPRSVHSSPGGAASSGGAVNVHQSPAMSRQRGQRNQMPPPQASPSPSWSPGSPDSSPGVSPSPSSPTSAAGRWARRVGIAPPGGMASFSSASDYDDSYYSALESEWDRFASPLTLLAGAEALYGGLEHLSEEESHHHHQQQQQQQQQAPSPPRRRSHPTKQRSRIKMGSMRRTTVADETRDEGTSRMKAGTNYSAAAEKVMGMYDKIRADLIIVREILCDPILGSVRPPDAAEGKIENSADDSILQMPEQAGGGREQQPQSEAYRSATSLASTVSVLVRLVDARKELISIHSDLVNCRRTESADAVDGGDRGNVGDTDAAAIPLSILELARRCDALLMTLPRGGSDSTSSNDDTAACESSGEADCGYALPMVDALRHEIMALSAALKAAEYLKRCSFFDTIMHTKRLKLHLSPASPFYSEPPSPLQLWLRSTLTGLLSCMSMYFDRIDAFANSTYGFHKHIFVEDRGTNENAQMVEAGAGGGVCSPGSVSPPSPRACRPRNLNWYGVVKNYDAEVINLLHRHEDKHGPPIAVAVILDAETGSRPDFERGFVSVDAAEASESPDGVDGLRSFPAIFLRTSLRSGDLNADSAGNAAAAFRRGRHNSAKGMSMASLSQLLTNPSSVGEMIAPTHSLAASKRPSHSGATPRSSQTTLLSHDNSQQSLIVDGDEALEITPSPKVKASEYWPTNGATSWPHSEWPNLVSLLIDDNRSLLERIPVQEGDAPLLFGPPFTFHDTTQRPTSKGGLFGGGEEEQGPPPANASMASVDEMSAEVGSPPRSSPQSHLTAPSAYHIIRLSERMWMTVVVKGEEGKWHRRKARGLSDDEIRCFLSDMASKLSVDWLFSMAAVITSRDASQRLDLPAFADAMDLGKLGSSYGAKDSERVLSDLKSTFGMKPSSPLLAPLKSPYIRKGSSVFMKRSRSRGGTPSEQAPVFNNTDNGAFALFMGTELSRCLLRT